VLHTRSLRYGKLRNGVFLAVSGGGAGGGAGVVRSRRQVWSFDGATAGSGKIDVVLGVNGYVFIGAGVIPPEAGMGSAAGMANLEDGVSLATYSSQNDHIGAETMREIARVRSVIVALVEKRLRVDEDTVMRGYYEAVEMAR